MATVWRGIMYGAAWFTRQVAIKKIKPEYQAIQNYINMFVEEARVGADLAHPHIVQVHDFIIESKSYYLIMEWVEGMDLGALVRAFSRAGLRTPWTLLTAITIDTLRGLAAAHERHQPDGRPVPVIHRDVSPQNILISVNGIAKLSDFGLARARDRVFSLTAPGTVKGKLTYLAPEVTYGQPASPASDLFSMGNVLWEALAGRRLFRGKTDLETFTQIRACNVPRIDSLRPDLPAELVHALHTALAREPDERFASARDMAKALAKVAGDTGFGDDLRLELGSVIYQARSSEGITADWQGRAAAEEPRWQSPLESKWREVATIPSMLVDSGVDIEFSDPRAEFTDSIEVEFTNPRLKPPRGPEGK